MSKKSGISLIVLVITIIIILILMAATFISYLDVTPVENANEVAFKSDLEGFKVELSTYIQNQRIEKRIQKGLFEIEKLYTMNAVL